MTRRRHSGLSCCEHDSTGSGASEALGWESLSRGVVPRDGPVRVGTGAGVSRTQKETSKASVAFQYFPSVRYAGTVS